MTTPWLHIVGIGDNGLDSLAALPRNIAEGAEFIFGASRHHAELADLQGEKRVWPSPFDALITDLKALKGRRVVVLATGDPLWYSVGARIGREIDPAEIVYHPQVSAFQLSACRMGWSVADVETLTIHGRPAGQILPFVYPGQKLLILTQDENSPSEVAKMLHERGFGPSRLTVLSHMGGEKETRVDGTAATWNESAAPFNTLAVECIAEAGAAVLPRNGLPDSAFVSDGNMTKRDIRAITLAKLAPVRGGLLWDIGCGSGSVAIEWMRAARDARAIGIEKRPDRLAFAAQNAATFGAPGLKLIEGEAPVALDGLPSPDAVFVGGGLRDDIISCAMDCLKPHGRLVANAVTLEAETTLASLRSIHGGDLVRISIEQAQPVGQFSGWTPSRTITQWSWVK